MSTTILEVSSHQHQTALSSILIINEQKRATFLQISSRKPFKKYLLFQSFINDAFLPFYCPPPCSPWGSLNTSQLVSRSSHHPPFPPPPHIPLASSSLGQVNRASIPRQKCKKNSCLFQKKPKPNSYHDQNCQQYAGHAFPSLDPAIGGPSGSQSTLWVEATDTCYDTCGRNFLSNPPISLSRARHPLPRQIIRMKAFPPLENRNPLPKFTLPIPSTSGYVRSLYLESATELFCKNIRLQRL